MASLLSLHLPKPKPNPIKATTTTTTTTTTSSPSPTTTTQLSFQALEEKFGRKGVKFTESGGVILTVRNGSSLSLRASDGLITSYRPKVYWKDDGFEEVLHTVNGGGDDVKGGIGLVVNDASRTGDDGSPWSASDWVVKDSDSDSIDAVQVELSCTNGDGSLDITYIISLYPLSVATAVIVKNTGPKPAKLSSAILSHFKVRSRHGSAVRGLTGCSYCAHPPVPSRFGILSPAEAMQPEPPSFLGSLFGGNENRNVGDDLWTVEDKMYTILRDRLSRVYAAPPVERSKRIYNTPPSKYETIDQGSGLGFRVIRMGYDDIYLGSPGSSSRKHGKDYFICTGPASMLVPVVINSGEEWRGAQVIEHDNL